MFVFPRLIPIRNHFARPDNRRGHFINDFVITPQRIWREADDLFARIYFAIRSGNFKHRLTTRIRGRHVMTLLIKYFEVPASPTPDLIIFSRERIRAN